MAALVLGPAQGSMAKPLERAAGRTAQGRRAIRAGLSRGAAPGAYPGTGPPQSPAAAAAAGAGSVSMRATQACGWKRAGGRQVQRRSAAAQCAHRREGDDVLQSSAHLCAHDVGDQSDEEVGPLKDVLLGNVDADWKGRAAGRQRVWRLVGAGAGRGAWDRPAAWFGRPAMPPLPAPPPTLPFLPRPPAAAVRCPGH